MAKTSILVEDLEHCYLCGKPYPQMHHTLHGTANRKIADKYCYIVPLCLEHHTGSQGVHHNKQMDLHFKRMSQMHFEEHYGTRKDFIQTFGKSFI